AGWRGPAAASTVLALALACRPAGGQGNELSAPTGGRSALMGRTGVALSRDGSAPFLNPATIVRIDDSSLAFSVNFYTFASTSFGGWHQPGPVDTSHFGNVALNGTSVSTSGFRVIPSTLCLFFTIRGVTAQGSEGGLHRGRQKLALCFGTTEYDDVVLPALSLEGKTSLGTTSQVQSITRAWSRFQAGPTYSITIADDVAIGVSLHGLYTSESFAIGGSSITSVEGGGAVPSSLDAAGSARAFDLAAIVGAAFHRGPWTFGASIQVPTAHVFGSYNATLRSQYDLAGIDTANITSGSGNFSAPPPMRFALGAGVETGRWVLELDESFQLPVAPIRTSLSGWTTGSDATVVPFSAAYAVQEHPVWNTGIGGEYFASKSFSLVGGASTSLSSLPSLSPAMSLGNLVQARSSSVSASLGVGSYGGGTDLLIGAQLGYAWGQSMAVNPYVLPNDWAVVDTRSYSVMLILAGSTDLRAIARAVEKVENAVSNGNAELSPPAHAPGPDKPPASRELPKSGE
ncbi:MAG TPA: hypothetical protein VIY73_19615, partial [Polyangiaceae bacterium]